MTALEKYQRLEATGLWRAHPKSQRREVIASIGDASLTLFDMAGRAQAHWSLAAIKRANPGKAPPVFHPDGNPGETLEFAEDETDMIQAMTRIHREVLRRNTRPQFLGRLASTVIAVSLLAGFLLWLPYGLRNYAVRVVPEGQRMEIGAAVLAQFEPQTGAPCTTSASVEILNRLARRVRAARIVVLPDGKHDSLSLPGGLVALHRRVVENHEDPAVPAGYALVETVRQEVNDPLAKLLQHQGIFATFALLTTGTFPPDQLERSVREMLETPPVPVPDEALLARFAEVSLPSTPYATATGSSQTLIDGDPIKAENSFEPVLQDSDWVQLQAICKL